MSHITLRVFNSQGEKLVGIKIPNLLQLPKLAYHKINDYFGIQEGTSDVAWWWGFILFSGLTGLFILVMNMQLAAL